ncbi:hypothetical protein FB45DRAFT_740837 [Roridomyces roridus]|uniref:Biotrophy-associated secreted protein 2 n=1 Tax=Roridomyces roridus TaxID=1738132 RepID=A0AAD7C5M1_9AGAR|nr:hypothetical protein FB45DRAFT_740837 [Roridomyces roridus]
MKFTATFVALTLVAIGVQAHELPSRYASQRRGNQFVTGPCTVDSDCQQGCCAFNTGKCAGPAVAQTRDGGCGFGSPAPNCDVAHALGLSDCAPGATSSNSGSPAVQSAALFVSQLDNIPFTPSSASSNNAGSGSAAAPPPPAAPAVAQSSKKTVFEVCAADSECQQGCCGFLNGKCAGPAVSQTNGNGGCGHGSAKPNCDVATLLGFQSQCVGGFANNNLQDATILAAARFTAQLDGLSFSG